MANRSHFKFSTHALEQMFIREISAEEIMEVIYDPDAIYKEENEHLIYQKVLTRNGADFLYRVFVNPDKIPNLIKTAYRTSKINKYL
ncbi:DUF4258 domain-containing protein [Dyadobacter psychrotolerans]|uniref:DUF4258 domain-containing protein n=1 Tax=Dyadobacter psychrotolerans TaxID=2541721 RepID=A0A4R5DZG4_9BACT|nr:DUF4258 domain-containing protein [Dyadobacter psychrotolerans]TDE16633.1 DUF4258 domain-containing protein [Dyadobacter psychrotolerans]